MSLSSIFSFESVTTVRPKFPGTILAVVLLLVGLELTCRRVPAKVWADANSHTERLRWMDENVVTKYDNPRIIFLGSSRTLFGIAPKVMEDELHLPPRSCANLGIISGTPEDGWKYFQRHQDRLQTPGLVIFVVDEWHFNGRNAGKSPLNSPATETPGVGSPMVAYWQGLFRSLFSFEYLTLREKLPSYVKDLSLMTGLRKPPKGLNIDADGQVLFDDVYRKDLTATHFKTTIDSYYHNFKIDTTLMDPLKKLSAHVKNSGGNFVLLQLPNRRGFHQEVLRLRGKEYEAHLDSVRKFAAELAVPFYAFESPEDCGLTEECYADEVHLRPGGARQLTRFLVSFLNEEKLDRKHEAQ